MFKASLDPEVLYLARLNRGPYLAALCAPRRARAELLALIAFDAEIARIPRIVSDPALGCIRLQWWLDVLPEICRGHPPSHRIAQALASLGLPLSALGALVEARNFDLETIPATRERKVAYAEATGGALHVLMLDIAGRKERSIEDPHGTTHDIAMGITMARDIGTAWVLSGMKTKGAPDKTAHALAFDLLGPVHRNASVDQTTLALARLVLRRLKNPDAPMGVSAAVSVWWGCMTGRL